MILSLFELEVSEKSEIIGRMQKNWDYSPKETRKEIDRLGKEGYLHQTAKTCRLSASGEELQLDLVSARDKIL